MGRETEDSYKREASMQGFKVKVSKICRGSEWGSAIGKKMRLCERERKRELGSAGTTEKEERGR